MIRIFSLILGLNFAAVFLVIPASLSAQTRETPYWATIDSEEVNMRVGPSRDYPIAWVYRRDGLPIKVVRVRESWRLIEDMDGDRGWVVRGLLSDARGAVIIGEGVADMRESADQSSALLWRLEPGVVGKLGRCEDNWCRFDVSGRSGWVKAARLWGAGAP